MGPGTCRQAFESGELPSIISLRHSDPYLTETIGHLGFDGVVVDLQHGPIGYEAMYLMLTALAVSQSTPMVRLPDNDPAMAMKALDAGAYGIICPGIESAADAARFVSACHYPPIGFRSLGPNRAALVPGYAPGANAEVITIVAVSTEKGFANLEKILEVPHLDAVLLEGPVDAVIDYVTKVRAAGRWPLVVVDDWPLTEDNLPECGVLVRDDIIYWEAFRDAVSGLARAATAEAS